MLEQGEILTLENDEDYVVASSVMLDGFNYVFLVNQNKLSSMMICKYDNVDGLIEEDDSDVVEKVLNLFNEQLNGPTGITPESLEAKKKEINEYLSEHSNEEN